MQRRILIIEDNRELAALLELHLRDAGYAVALAFDGASGLGAAERERYDLVVLDLMLPELDGLAVCRELRQRANYVPIIMLTAKTSELDRVLGLELGADDYVTKPFSIPEVLARIKAIFRRVDRLGEENPAPPDVIRRGELVIDPERRLVTIRRQTVDLTAREFDLLFFFASRPGKVFTRALLLDAVWGYGHEGYEHTVNSHINRLRAKIEDDPRKPRYIQTVWGVGYKFADGDNTL